MEANNGSELADDAVSYCSIAEAMKLIMHPFDGDKR
jgi:hypothetical protein